MSFANETSLEDIFKNVKKSHGEPGVSRWHSDLCRPDRTSGSGETMTSTVTIDVQQVPLRTSLKLLLNQLGLAYQVKDGLLKITSEESAGSRRIGERRDRAMCRRHGWHGRRNGASRWSRAQASGGARSTRRPRPIRPRSCVSRTDRARTRRRPRRTGRASRSRSPGGLTSPRDAIRSCWRSPASTWPADYYAKAVPVLTPRVYRLAKLTNKSDFVLLPGEATVYVGGDFVGRMRLPLVAAGEPFIAGFGVDPQLQVSRRLVHKARSVQGGNQIFDYEFRIGLRNYRPGPVKVQLWDRLPKPQGEAVAVNLVKTSSELSTDAPYQRTARMDNLLRWDVDRSPGHSRRQDDIPELRVPPGVRPRPSPTPLRLRRPAEGPIGGGAMGMGGMGGGMRSVNPRSE